MHMTITAASEMLVLNQLPQPETPPNIDIPSTDCPPQQSIDENYVHAVPVPPSIAKEEEEGERKMTRVSKLVNRVLDKYEKLPASLKDHINLEEMLGMKMKRRVETQNTTSRGPQHPINEKLERFKVRPVFPYEEDNKN
ncbi:hypothetical protein AAZX31_03G172500 [Glycine max]|nr:hypothetical protein GYH30_007713 [Glycine max]